MLNLITIMIVKLWHVYFQNFQSPNSNLMTWVIFWDVSPKNASIVNIDFEGEVHDFSRG